MADQVGLIVQGDEDKNDLNVEVVHEDNGDLSIYNIIHAGDGGDELSGRPSTRSNSVIKQYGVQLFGEGGNDQIADSFGNDTLNGGIGNDSIFSGYGHDIIDGGEGTDTLYTPFRMRLSSVAQTIVNVERLSISGTVWVGDFDMSQFEAITAFGRAAIIFTQAQTGDLHLRAGGEWRLTGSDDNDALDISGQHGAFTISGAAGSDNITGSDGLDRLNGQAGNDTLVGGDGHDIIDGGIGDDQLSGGDGDDWLKDGNGKNAAYGGDGDDTFNMSGNMNLLNGGEGTDLFYLSTNHDKANGGGGDDIFYGGDDTGGGNWTLNGGEGDDSLLAGGNLSGLRAEGVENLVLGFKPKLVIGADALDSFDRISYDSLFTSITVKFSSGGDFTLKNTPRGGSISKLALLWQIEF